MILTTEQRHDANEARLMLIYKTLRPKVRAVLADLESHGWQPIIDAQVHRTPEQQARLVAQGRSKVRYSYHNVSGPNGEPQSLAADIVDARYGWKAPSSFWLMLASSARAHGMESGLFWGLNRLKRLFIETLIRNKEWGAKYAQGWDAAHVNVRGISLRQARRGVRPK